MQEPDIRYTTINHQSYAVVVAAGRSYNVPYPLRLSSYKAAKLWKTAWGWTEEFSQAVYNIINKGEK